MSTDPDFATTFKVAHEALVRVSKGSSERDAVSNSIARNHRSIGLTEKALALVLATVNEQDLLDDVIGRIFVDRRFSTETRCLLRLVANVIFRSDIAKAAQRLEHGLRNTLAPELVPMVELVLGTLVGLDDASFTAQLSDVDRISIKTHNPSWWVRYCYKLLGRQEALNLLSSQPRVRYVRVNSLKNHGRLNLPKSDRDWTSVLENTSIKSGVYVLKTSASSL
ncbi:MAG TPA: hypothetical protein VFV92_06995, partial [Candidatus Bathyarchaeia archaeon]|nr:hypothetical protein [Candidatus Bathyarchaeia archaeon]